LSIATASRTTSPHARRRILVGTPFAPRLDARHGGKATTQLLARLAERHDVAVLYLRGRDERSVDPRVEERCELVEEVVLPDPGTGWRRRLHWGLGLARGLPPWALDCSSGRYEARMRELVRSWKPELVQLDLQVMAQYAACLDDSGPARILVDYDPPAAWSAELVREANGLTKVARQVEAAAWRRYELATRKQFDSIVVFAERDVQAVAPTAGGVSIVTIPLAIDVPLRPLDPVGTDPPTVVFVGGFSHPPNVDAARWLTTAIFPRVRASTPGARLQLVGNRPGEDVRGLAGGVVEVHGSVADVTPFVDAAAVVAAPIRLGGSIRMKVLETLAAGKALVATPRAMAGARAEPGRHYVAADTEDDFAAALVALLQDPERRRALGTAARSWAEAELSWDRPVAQFEQVYAAAIAQRS
jgi:glycosyltransferase involved in cell wall biosynthesis